MKQALILAAGRGARLDRPNTPKPLVEVGGQPMVVRLIKQLRQAGIKKIHVVVGYESTRIMHALSSYFGYETGLVFHSAPNWQKGSAHSVLCARPHIQGNFILAMADHVFDDSLIASMTAIHPGANEVVALVDRNGMPPSSYDTAVKVRTSEDGSIEDAGLNIIHPNAVDAGLFAASSVLFDVLSNLTHHGKKAELMDGLRVLAKTDSLFYTTTQNEKWFDVDTPADVIRAESHLRRARRERALCPVNTSRPATETQAFDYHIQIDQCTEMLMCRGLVAAPEHYPIIPRQSASSPVFVFTDETVSELYGNRFVSRLRGLGYNIHAIVLPDGEEAKTISNYVYLVERVLSRGVDERSVFISLGGGVVCNVCGFVASTIYRGLELIHIPTTLMAQCDAAISHKQAINGHFGKNMVGTYYSPSKVLVDVETLQTLNDRQIRDGYAEVIKHALSQDVDLANMLFSFEGDIRSLSFLEKVIERNVMLKCELVRQDPKELNEAMVLQYGHTAGHPLEHLSGYTLYHGESVAIGMIFAARVAALLGACDDATVNSHYRLIRKFGLPTEIPREIQLSDFMEALKFNKRHVMEGSQMA
ncbi:MAG: iron-containing alcohol dehydrogenase, partial [Deltaproteobacteria bacterium]|nr:iron-containing alcohol dehydrogenase [Deltaproteobacteria bacterium]